MWGPGLAAILTGFIYRNKQKLPGLAIRNKQYLAAGYLLPVLYAVPVYVALWFFGFASFNKDFTCNYFYVFTIAQLLQMLASTGEEIGWRGYLYPKLCERTSRFNAAFFTGIIWAAWQLPILISAQREGAPLWFAISCFSLMTISMSFIMAWLRDRSRNIWPAVLMNASHRFYIAYFLDHLTKHSPNREYLFGEYGMGLALSTFTIATMLWLKHENSFNRNHSLVHV